MGESRRNPSSRLSARIGAIEHGMTDQDDARRHRGRALVGLVLVIVVVVAWLLWRDLTGTNVLVSLDDELEGFPAPAELTLVSDVRTGTGAPFWGERRGRKRVYASDADPERTCALLRAALEAWQVDAGSLTADSPRTDPPRPICNLTGSRDTGTVGTATAVHAVVYPTDQYVELFVAEQELPLPDPPPPTVVDLRLTR